jgi:hypothetical protein
VQKTDLVEIKTASFTVTAQDSGKIYVINAADVVATLPATAAGLQYTFVVQTLSTTTGFGASPVAADSVNGGTDNKDLQNSAATDALGDSVTIVGDGSVGWWTISKIGTWAEES